MARPRLTKTVREGWEEIRSYITCELESPQGSQFACKEDGEPSCRCEGCIAVTNAFAAVAWIDGQMRKSKE